MFRKLIGLLAVAVTGLLLSSVASAQMATTAHDFRGDLTGSGATDQICVVCHAPHGNLNSEGDLLWNRTVQTVGAYTPYSNTNGTIQGTISGPGATSLLCLGCHDGQVAVDNYGTIVGGNQPINGINFGGLAAFDTDLSNDHPIGITYDSTGTTGDPELNDPSTTMGSNDIAYYLQNGAVECATCHDVHATDVVGTTPLLIVTNVGSAICTTCHAK